MFRSFSLGTRQAWIAKESAALALTSALERLLDGHLGEGVETGIDMIIDKKLLDELTASAQASARLRMNFDLRNSASDGSQRMLNALEPGTVMPIHRHHDSSETVVILRGKIRWTFYDEDGKETERVTLDANGEPRMLNVEKDRWHSLDCLESGSVLFESKDGAWRELGEGEVMRK